MKLTKKLQAEILKVYNTYWDAYLKGDMKTFASMLADDISVFGTAVSEVFNNKRETLRFYKATADQLVGKAQFRNRKNKMHVVDNNVLVNQQCDLYFLMDEKWTYYGHIRVSAIFKQIGSGWKLAHQHASFPDTRAEEGEQVAAEKIKAENIQLRDAVKRRTIELEEKNRELEIETALEKVRAVAMGMKKADDMLSICKAISKQLAKLGVKEIRNVQTAIIYENKGTYINYEYYAKQDKLLTTDVNYTLHKEQKAFVKKMLKGPGEFYTHSFKGKKLKDWYAFQKTTNQFADRYLEKAKSLNYYLFSLGEVMLGITTYHLLSKEEINLFKRFLNVFELAYRRYLDIKKAEAQAREAQIEAALERVRSKTNAMHRSEDLHKVIREVHDQLRLLEFRFDGVDFMTDYSDKGFNIWLAAQQHTFSAPINVPAFGHKIFRTLKKVKKERRDFFTFTLNREEKNKYIKHLVENTIVKNVSEGMKQHILAAKGWATSCVVLENIILSITNLELIPYTDAENAIIKRFAHVFQQSYTRFLDLQTSEAQTREAKIETSLERVRAKTMAMHKSSDLLGVVKVLGEQFELLGFKFQSVNFDTDFQEKNWNLWLYNSGSAMYPGKIHIPYIDHPCFNKPLDAFKKGGDLHSFIFTKEEKDSLFDHIYANSVAKYGSDERKRFTYAAPGFAMSIAVTKNTRITIANYNAEPFSEEENAILRRFANVFEQSYTRFLDLQKAEAQARETEIELALERVRARTMAMQKSDELREAVLVIYEQLKLLHFESSACNIIIIDKGSNSAQYWVSGFSQEIFPVSYTVPYFNHPYQDMLLKPWKQGDKYVVYEYEGRMKQNFDEIFFTQTDFKNVPGEAKNVMMGLKSVMLSTAFMTYGALQSLGAEPLSDENANILQRFAKVFEQTYRRFLDLQKAEAQTREAQIEAALERVRSRTMAMQKTDELLDAAELVHKELAALGINSMNVSYAFVDEDEKYASYYSINPVDGRILPIPFIFPHTDTDVMRSILASWKKWESFNVIELKEKATLKHQSYIGEHIRRQLAKINVPFSIEEFLSVSPKKAVLSTFNFANGYLFNIGEERLSKIQEELMLRFTRVFEQTYTRFLDLQKAEAQAREAQIEAALERVRSRTMGMQKSDELKEVIQVVYEQFVHLNIHVEHTGFIMDYKKRDDMHIWLADKHAVPFQVTIPYFDCAHWNSFKEAKEKGIDFFANQLSFEEKNKFYQDLFKLIPGVPEETLEYYFSCPGLAISTVLLENVGLYIENFSGIPYTDEENNTLMRFGKVFQQTYTRFLDLQKAEAQAREAQIETALEKVRSHTMGMRSSDDLANVATVMFDQMRILGGDLFSFGIVLCDKHVDMVEQWHGIPHAGMLAPFFVPVDLDHIHRFRYDQWKAGVELFSIVIPEDYITHHFDLMLELPSVKAVWEGIAAKGIPLPPIPTWEMDYGASFRYGYLLVSALKPFEEDKIFPRFAKVFEQAYTRFLDLQKAEAQAREAQIEAALERVRSRTMAMQRSEELLKVINIFSDQLTKLNISFDNVSFGVNDQADDFKFWLASAGQPHPIQIQVPYYNNPAPNRVLEAQKKGLKFFADILTAEENKLWVQHLIAHSELKALPDNVKNYLLTSPGFARSTFILKNINFYIGNYKNIAYTEEENNIFKRFAQAFEQSYIRFLDLQKAEAQAREAQIELGLERVRARAMAMQNSDELKELIGTVFIELTKLDLVLTRCLIVIFDPKTKGSTWWMANSEAPSDPIGLYVKYHDHPPYLSYVKAWQERNLKWQYILEGKDKKEWDDFLFVETELSHLPDFVIAGMKAPDRVYLNASFNSFGNLTLASLEPLSNEHFDILLRFAKVFDLTYTRFNDLKQAEAQAREAQIELGLERVRARAMAMQKSDELSELVDTVFKELTKLDFALTWCIINIIDESSLSNTVWAANPDINKAPESYHMLFEDYPFHHAMMKGWKERRTRHVYVLEGQEKKIYDEYLFNETEFRRVPAAAQAASRAMEKYVVTFSFSNFGGLQTVGDVPLTDANVDILSRFGKVFDLTYTRFNDLKQAEAQTRESQIQLALERVRARTMAMQKSDELPQAANLLFQQVQSLGMPAWSAGYCTWDNDKKTSITLSMSSEGVLQPTLSMPLTKDPSLMHFREAWARGESFFVEEVGGEELKTHYTYLRTLPGVKETLDEIEAAGFPVPTFQIFHLAYFSKGFLLFITYEPVPEAHDIFKRFAKVFEQTYTRFLDLQKAEAQAREAQIETALEKVRSSSLAMHHSNEIKEVVKRVFNQMKELGFFQNNSVMIVLPKNEFNDAIHWTFNENFETMEYYIPSFDHPVSKEAMKRWRNGQKSFEISLDRKEKDKFLDLIFSKTDYSKVPEEFKKFLYTTEAYNQFFAFELHCGLLVDTFTPVEYTKDQKDIVTRFTKVFEQAYIRFLDLQKAESQAREAQIETALERVRSRTLAMHKSEELAETAVVLFKQMIGLGIEPNRLYIAIINDDSGDLEFWITDENGEKVSSRYMVNIHKNISIKKMYEGWATKKKTITIDMQGKELEDWLLYWKEEFHVPFKPGAALKRRVQNIAYFSKGFVAIASPDDQPESTINLLERFAAVFNLTYTRFNDLKIAEAHAFQAEEDLQKLHTEKRRTEEALTELQATQKQLIQSEKMASLGELTAGIAHEIQNPLNFVNNFSEVSNELIEEMKEELAKGNWQLANEIAEDVKQNLEKINHHGKRADGIVKGMLQHSRTSSGQKEPTDINVLAEEYLRLAYHGLRAKDKFFNAKFETDFDPAIDKIDLVQQDIGRVILNLINNAFYAVDEKKRQVHNGYEPVVTINTRKLDDTVEIAVKDNGNGVPKKVLDKIFQPFFTTKPTGQGTGLGLSLAYDIIKTLGGELKVDTEEGKGANFIISIPIIDKR